MAEQLKIIYNEIDFLIPTYRFKIQYSYTTKRGLSFIREFVLRLVHLSPMKPAEISEFLGLTEHEAIEAIRDLIERNELIYNEFGQVILTAKAKGYFTELGVSPKVSTLVSTGTILGFETTAFNCVSSNIKRLNDKWICGLRVNAKSDVIANRVKLAEKAFQTQFHALLDKEVLSNKIETEGSGHPNIYKIDSVKQIGQEPLRIKLCYSMNENGMAIDVDDIDHLHDDSAAHDAISQIIKNNQSRDNFNQVILAIESFGDMYTGSLINKQGLNVEKFNEFRQSNNAENGNYIPFIGPLYSLNNWKTFSEQLNGTKKQLINKHQESIKKLNWLAPNESIWGHNNNIISCLDSIVNGSKTNGEKAKSLYDPTLYLPLESLYNHQNKNRWKNDFSKNLNNVNAYIEGFAGGSVEVLLLENELVAVTYYISLPDIYPVSVPVGFISKNKALVKQVQNEVQKFISSLYDHENRRDLGKLSKLIKPKYES